MRFSFGLLCSILLLCGCATTSVDWSARAGHYTYDAAVSELGVPERTATLSDGTLIAEWLDSRGTTYGTYYSFPGSRIQTFDVNRFPDRCLRLVFGPDRRLIRAEKFTR